MRDASPTARALQALELIHNSPGINAERLADRLGVSERAVRRYVGILREAGVPIESARGRYGGYRVGRGHRLPPLMFTNTEALGLVMAVLEGNHAPDDPADPVGSALGKIIRVLPEPVARPVAAVRNVTARPLDVEATNPSAETTALLAQACASSSRLRLAYRLGPGHERVMEVDPWAVVVRFGRWYLLCWSHTKNARRALRLDRVVTAHVLTETFSPPADLEPMRALEEHLSQGWKYQVEVVIDAPAARVARWIPRTLGRVEELSPESSLLVASTDEPDWYAQQLTALRAPFRVVGPPEVLEAVRRLAQRLMDSGLPPVATGQVDQ